jgi:hypothetical protein
MKERGAKRMTIVRSVSFASSMVESLSMGVASLIWEDRDHRHYSQILLDLPRWRVPEGIVCVRCGTRPQNERGVRSLLVGFLKYVGAGKADVRVGTSAACYINVDQINDVRWEEEREP